MKPVKVEKGAVYCPMCTHTVQVDIVVAGRTARVKDSEKCPRCGSPLGSALVTYRLDRAA